MDPLSCVVGTATLKESVVLTGGEGESEVGLMHCSELGLVLLPPPPHRTGSLRLWWESSFCFPAGGGSEMLQCRKVHAQVMVILWVPGPHSQETRVCSVIRKV